MKRLFNNAINPGKASPPKSLVEIQHDYVMMQEPNQKSVLPDTGLGTTIEQKNGLPLRVDESKVGAPMALRTEMYNVAPIFAQSTPGSITVSHREMITAIQGTANTDTFPYNYRIQPCNAFTFPWLHKIANLFETYTFTNLKFIYVPRVPATYAGQIGMAIDFDADDLPASTLSQFSSYRNSVVGSIWSGNAIAVEGEALQKCVVERYTDHGLSTHPYDPILHDVGNLRVAVLAPADTAVVGQIYVEYTIILRTPEPPSDDTNRVTYCKVTPTGTGTSQLYMPFGEISQDLPVVLYQYNDIPIHFYGNGTTANRGIWVDRPGKYRWSIRYRIAHSAGHWDTTSKWAANCDLSYTNTYITPGSVDHGSWPYDDLQAEVNTDATGTDHLITTHGSFECTAPTSFITPPAITYPAGAGLDGTVACTAVYIVIEEVVSFPQLPALKTSLKNSSLTPQQRAHPLGSIWSDAINEAYSIAQPALKFLYKRYMGGGKKVKKMKNRKNIKILHKQQKKRSKK